MDNAADIKSKLRQAGLKATPARLAVLDLLASQAKPMDANGVMSGLAGRAPDLATVYRILTALTQAGLLREVVLKAGTANYEIADMPHHHHLVCEKCGLVEDVTVCCDDPKPASAMFSFVTSHNLEFTGICQKCA